MSRPDAPAGPPPPPQDTSDPRPSFAPPDPAVPPGPAIQPGPFGPLYPPPPGDAAFAVPPVVGPPVPRPRWRRTRRACSLLAVAGVLATVGGVVVAVRTAQLADTPAAAVQAYFAALSRGDARTALAAGTVPAGGRVLLTDDVLRATLAVAPLRDVRTGAVTRTGDTASVAVTYRLGGTTPSVVDDRVELVRTDGRWRLRESAVPVELSVEEAASWAAVPASRPFAVPTDAQVAFPGAVPVVFRAPRLQERASTAVIRFASTDNGVTVSAELSTRGRAELTQVVSDALRRCAAGGADTDPFCPQPEPGRDDGVVLRSVPTSFRGTLQDVDRPDLDIAVSPEIGGTIAVSGSIEADGTWQVLDYDNVAQERNGKATISFAGTVAIGSDALRWERSP